MAETEPMPGLYRLLAWASPSFPTGAFSYSHGLEAMVADATVRDRTTLQAWIAAVISHGSGRLDADLLRDAYRAVITRDMASLDAVNRLGTAFRATAELALESAQQGEAFKMTHQAAWPPPRPQKNHPSPPARGGREGGKVGLFSKEAFMDGEWSASSVEGVCHGAIFGAATASAGIALDDALVAYLHAFAGNLVSAGIRLGVVGQTDGQRILAALEPVVADAAAAALARVPEDFGSATFAVDLASMTHETQYSRLFRS